MGHWHPALERETTREIIPGEEAGITVNRRDLVSIPVPVANLLWRNLHVRDVRQSREEGSRAKKPKMSAWTSSWTVLPRTRHGPVDSNSTTPTRNRFIAGRCELTRVLSVCRFLTKRGVRGSPFSRPCHGLADREFVKEPGEIGVLIGQGQTAQVLRNLCHQIYKNKDSGHWDDLVKHIRTLFGLVLLAPEYIAERSEITMAYKDERGNHLDLSSSGRGLQQTLLLLAHLYANPGAVLLLDEPDAHLEILRQRQTYNLLIQIAEQQGSQIIAASHSEIVLNEAAGRDVVIAFVGNPHRIDDRGSQVLKALRDIGFDQYYQAEETGWVLYVENSTDLAILQAFAKSLDHEAQQYLERPFVKYVETNLPSRAREHFFGLQEAKNDLVGIAIFDRLDSELQSARGLDETMWRRREIENYFCHRQRPCLLMPYTTCRMIFSEKQRVNSASGRCGTPSRM